MSALQIARQRAGLIVLSRLLAREIETGENLLTANTVLGELLDEFAAAFDPSPIQPAIAPSLAAEATDAKPQAVFQQPASVASPSKTAAPAPSATRPSAPAKSTPAAAAKPRAARRQRQRAEPTFADMYAAAGG